MTVTSVLAAMRRRWLLVVGVFVVMGLLVALNLALTEREYTATAQVSFSSTAEGEPLGIDNLGATIAALANGRDVLEDVQDDIDGARSIRDLREEVNGAWIQSTILVEISATDRDPQLAADIANGVAANLNRHLPQAERIVLTTTDTAVRPESPSKPSVPVVVGAGGLLALLLAAAGAVWADRRRRTLSSPAEVGQALETPVLATLPAAPPAALPALTPGSSLNAGFRTLRIALESSRHGGRRIVVVPSAAETALVASWTALNIAVSIGTLSRRVLLIDGARDTSFGPAFPGTAHRRGLQDVLRGTLLEACVVPGPMPGVEILGSGAHDGLFTEELLEGGFGDVVEKAASSYDAVVVLAPPASLTQDALVLAHGAATLLVVPRATHRPGELETLQASLRAVGIQPTCAALVEHDARGRARSSAPAAGKVTVPPQGAKAGKAPKAPKAAKGGRPAGGRRKAGRH